MVSTPQATRLRDAARRGAHATMIGLGVSLALAAIKIVSGIVGHAYALVADGFESLLDVLGASIVWGSLRISARPPDAKHPYGHGKVEALAAMATAIALLGAAVAIALESIREIRTPHAMPAPFTLIVLVAVIIVKELLFRFVLRTSQDINSRAVETDAWHHRSDALTSLAAFLGISIALIRGPEYAAADDWAALFACGIIGLNGARLFRGAVDDLMDAAAPRDVESRIRAIATEVPGVIGTHHCRVRRSGMSRLVDLDVIVDGNISVRRGHEIAHDVKARLLGSDLDILTAHIHVEPNDRVHDPMPPA
jgi:cation diffusion facilitator family transporter